MLLVGFAATLKPAIHCRPAKPPFSAMQATESETESRYRLYAKAGSTQGFGNLVCWLRRPEVDRQTIARRRVILSVESRHGRQINSSMLVSSSCRAVACAVATMPA